MNNVKDILDLGLAVNKISEKIVEKLDRLEPKISTKLTEISIKEKVNLYNYLIKSNRKEVSMSRAKNIIALAEDNINEEVDVQKVITDLINTDFGTDNDKQGKMVQLMRGLAFSDDPAATKFMKDVSDVVGKLNPEDYK